MKLRLSHGRLDPNENMQDIGFTGTIIENIECLCVIYSNPVLHFKTEVDLLAAQKITGWDTCCNGLEMNQYDDMIRTIEGYFGDWELYND